MILNLPTQCLQFIFCNGNLEPKRTLGLQINSPAKIGFIFKLIAYTDQP
jgi:hypothetical protein